MRSLALIAALALSSACATAGSTLNNGVGDRQLEHPPYYAGKELAAERPTVARFPVAFQRGASQDAQFDPSAASGTPAAALLAEMNAFMDSSFAGKAIPAASGAGMIAPNVYFGCDRGGMEDCPERGDSVLGRRGTTMRLAVERPSAAWIARNAALLDSTGASLSLIITLEVGQYWPRQRGLAGAKSVELGTEHVVSLPWLTSLETPVTVLQLTGALVNREGKATRIGAEGILAVRTPLVASGFGAQRVLSDADVARARTLRLADMPGQPLAWTHAMCAMIRQLGAGDCR